MRIFYNNKREYWSKTNLIPSQFFAINWKLISNRYTIYINVYLRRHPGRPLLSEKPSKSQISFYFFFFFRPKEILSQRLGVFCDSFTITDCKTERNNIVVNLQPKGNDGFLFSFICKNPRWSTRRALGNSISFCHWRMPFLRWSVPGEHLLQCWQTLWPSDKYVFDVVFWLPLVNCVVEQVKSLASVYQCDEWIVRLLQKF